MTAIKNTNAYPVKPSPVLTDKLIGSNSETIKKETASFELSSIQALMIAGLSPETGGTLKVTEIIYSGALTTPEDVANQLDPSVIVQRFEVLIFNINGNKYQLKLQDVVLGVLQDDVTSNDFIPISLVAENLSNTISFYKGLNASTGREEHYSIGSVGFSITKEIVLGNETGKILLEQTEQTNLGATGIAVYKGYNATTKLQEFRKIASSTATVSLTGETIFIEIPANDINITAGTNVVVTEPTPNNFVISATDTIAVLENSTTTTVSGNGTSGNEYQVEVNNLQKIVSAFPYTLVNGDDKYTIIVDNGASNVVINVPNTLPSNFSVAFIQKGTGDVTITPTGTSVINTAVGYKIKGQYYWALIEKELATVTHYLIGSTKL